jgi:hypothetical protein
MTKRNTARDEVAAEPPTLRWAAALLCVLSAVSGQRLDDDSYQHFARSVAQVATLDVAGWLTDVWNKPIPGLLFGVPGLVGLDVARWASVGTSVAMLYLTVEIGVNVIPVELRAPRWAMLALALSQPDFLRDAFVTMTETSAACCLALSLWSALCRGQPRAAAIAAGLMPLCRVEMMPLTALIAMWLAAPEFSGRRPGRGLSLLGLAALPFVVWFAAAALAAHDWAWFGREAYARLRAWDLKGCLRYNALTGLAGVVSPPGLFLFLFGLLSVRRILPARVAAVTLGCLIVHYTLLSLLDVFPEGVEGIARGHAVAAINARNYTGTAPIMTLYCGVGVAALVRRHYARDSAWTRDLALAAFLSTAIVLTFRASALGALARDLSVLGVSLLWLFWRTRAPIHERCSASTAWKSAAAASLLAALLMRPGFWYPTRWNDRRAKSIAAAAQLLHTHAPARVVQDIAASLAFYAGLPTIDAAWTWPNAFAKRLASAPKGSLVLFEVDAQGKLLTRYPGAIARCGSERALVAEYRSPREPPWLERVDRIGGRNQPVRWRAYRIMPNCTE